MSKVITFSRFFPSYHPRKGEPTYFVEKIIKARIMLGETPCDVNAPFEAAIYHLCDPKYHTIRAGHRFKVGDWFSPRVWSGKPYHSKQIIIAPDIQVKKVWNFSINDYRFWINNNRSIGSTSSEMKKIALNDGLVLDDFHNWFQYPKPFDGQIICWNDKIEY